MNEKMFQLCNEVPFLHEVSLADRHIVSLEGFFQEYEGRMRFIISIKLSDGEYIHRKVNIESEKIVTIVTRPSLLLDGIELLLSNSELKVQYNPPSWEFLINLLIDSEEL